MTHAAAVRDLLDPRVEEMIADLRLLVELETPSSRRDLLVAGLAAIEAHVIERLGPPADRVQHDGGRWGDVLELTWEGTAPGTALVLCHYDTVWPEGTLAAWPLTRDGDRLSGPGVLDMKVGLVQTVWAITALRALGAPHPTVRLLLNGDEEVGSRAGRGPIERAAAESDVTLIPEPSAAGHVKVQRKGMVFADVHVDGVESHAGLDPDAGASAIHELAGLVPRLVALADPVRGTTVNVGLIEGGSGRNVVAGHASCEVDVRIQEPGEEDRVIAALEALRAADPRTRLRIEIDRNRPPMNPVPATQPWLDAVAAVGAELGHEVGHRPVGGASDGNFVAALGLPLIDGLGGIGAGPHARHEHVLVSGLTRQTALLAGVLESVSAAASAASRPAG